MTKRLSKIARARNHLDTAYELLYAASLERNHAVVSGYVYADLFAIEHAERLCSYASQALGWLSEEGE